jgi:hypothetical protein
MELTFVVKMSLIFLNLVYYIQQEKIHLPAISFNIPVLTVSR